MLTRIGADRSLEENELSYLKADLTDIDDLINKKSGSDYLKLIAELEEAKGGIKLAEQTIVRLRKEKETNLEAINRVYMDTKRAEARVAECTDQIRTLSIDRTNIAMEVAGAKAQLEKFEAEIRQHGEDTEGAREQLFTLLKDLEEKKGQRSEILHQQDMQIEKSRMRTTELERLTLLLSQLDEEYTAKQSQLTDSEKRQATFLLEKKNWIAICQSWKERCLHSGLRWNASVTRSGTMNRMHSVLRQHSRRGVNPEAGRSKRLWPWNMYMARSLTLGKHLRSMQLPSILLQETNSSLSSAMMIRWQRMPSGT